MRPVAWLAAVAVMTLPAVAAAQSPLPPEPSGTPPSQIGPVALFPRFELTSIGMDNNVFNDEVDPRRDFTMSIRPSIEARLRFGITRFSYKSSMDAVYFHKYKEERSLDRTGEFRTELRFTRFVPYATLGGSALGNRPNNEIDLRADRNVRTFGAGIAVALLSRTALVGSFRRLVQEFDPNQEYEGVDLATQMNTQGDTTEGGVRLVLTSLTTLTVTGARERSSFEFAPERDSRSTRVTARFEFDPNALLTGSASFGYRTFDPASETLERYRGLITDVAVGYTRDRTRIGLRGKRDVEYSYQESAPYYVSTAGSITLTQKVAGPFDVQVLGSIERNVYRRFLDAEETTTPAAPSEIVKTVAAGIGYRWRDTTRLGVNYEYSARDTDDTRRPYDRNRVLGSLTYGF